MIWGASFTVTRCIYKTIQFTSLFWRHFEWNTCKESLFDFVDTCVKCTQRVLFVLIVAFFLRHHAITRVILIFNVTKRGDAVCYMTLASLVCSLAVCKDQTFARDRGDKCFCWYFCSVVLDNDAHYVTSFGGTQRSSLSFDVVRSSGSLSPLEK